MALESDPIYQQWLNTMGFQSSSAQSLADSAIDRANANLAFQLPRVDELGQRDVQDIHKTFENQGMYRSSGHETRVAQSTDDTAYQTAAMQLANANQVGSIQEQLAYQLAGLGVQNQNQLIAQQARNDAISAALGGAVGGINNGGGGSYNPWGALTPLPPPVGGGLAWT